jgi:hypothetical protein
VEQFTNSQIYEAIGNIVSQFDLYQCQDCAKTVLQWLADNHIEGELLQLRTRYNDENYIISDRLGNEQAITANGKHYGVEVRGLVFDNLSPRGMTKENWLNDFHCQSEEFILKEGNDQ